MGISHAVALASALGWCKKTPFVPSEVEGREQDSNLAFWVYILHCADDRYYTGQTDNLESRIAQHHAGGFCDFTSRRRPVRLAWSQDFSTRLEALEAERRIKPWSRVKKQALIRGDWEPLSYWAKPPKERPSTSLGTNGDGAMRTAPFVSSTSADAPGSRSGQAKTKTPPEKP